MTESHKLHPKKHNEHLHNDRNFTDIKEGEEENETAKIYSFHHRKRRIMDYAFDACSQS